MIGQVAQSVACAFMVSLRIQRHRHIYSPNSFRTLFITLSFSGSYGWSLDGISKSDGNASLYASTLCLILSAI